MKLAIFHYHLNRGGVTRVIANHLQSLATSACSIDRVLVACGGRRDDWPGGDDPRFQPLTVSDVDIPELEYDSVSRTDSCSSQGVDRLSRAIGRVLEQHECGPDDTLLHFHNHSLGKNLALPGAIRRLALQGYRLLLQIHDFAEDLRGDAYRSLAEAFHRTWNTSIGEQLYPQAAQIHYAVLNRRDFSILDAAGTAESNLHWLPNPVSELGAQADRRASRRKLDSDLRDRRLILYPVRGIRRKNLGEFLLWASLFGEDTTFALSPAPQNPVEQTSYLQWQEQAKRLQLPIVFDTGGRGGMTYTENLAAADAIITTSVAEGFGMVFLETWLADRPLLGRNLPEITADFEHAGLRLDRLSAQLRVPCAWFNDGLIREQLAAAYQQLCRSYGRAPLGAAQVQAELDRLQDGGAIDFAMLPPALQARVIARVRERNGAPKNELLSLNRWMAVSRQDDATNQHETISRNAAAVREAYSPAAVGEHMTQVYASVANSRPEPALQTIPREEAIVDGFLDFSRLHPVRFA